MILNRTKQTIEYYQQAASFYGTVKDLQPIARVNRTTWQRWTRGETDAPEATLELLRLHAFGEPPSGLGASWRGFRFQNEKLTTDDGRNLSPADLKAVFFWKQIAHDYYRIKNKPQAAYYEDLINAMQ